MSGVYHAYRCKECGLVRCDQSGATCTECLGNIATPQQPQPTAKAKPDPDAMLRKLMGQAVGNVAVGPSGAGSGASPAQAAPPAPIRSGGNSIPMDAHDVYRFLFVHRKYSNSGYLPKNLDQWRREIDAEILNTGWKP